MRLCVDGATYRGRAIDLDHDVGARAVLAAVRGDSDDSRVELECQEPTPVHDHVGYVGPDASLALTGALAAAARSRGLTAPQRPAIESARERLGTRDVAALDLASLRRRVAVAGADEDRLRERVATCRGRLEAAREAGGDVEAAEAALAEAVKALTEVETERIAAEQALAQAERDARSVRDSRERRLGLEDHLANLERAARRHLAAAVYEEFAAAVAALAGEPPAGSSAGEFDGETVTGLLAVARVAVVDAPLVLAASPFERAAAAAEWVDAPVVHL